MDPNETLRKQRELIAAIESGEISGTGAWADAAAEFFGLFLVLDDWLSKGGFLPDEWAPCRHDKGLSFDGDARALVCNDCRLIVGYDMRNEDEK